MSVQCSPRRRRTEGLAWAASSRHTSAEMSVEFTSRGGMRRDEYLRRPARRRAPPRGPSTSAAGEDRPRRRLAEPPGDPRARAAAVGALLSRGPPGQPPSCPSSPTKREPPGGRVSAPRAAAPSDQGIGERASYLSEVRQVVGALQPEEERGEVSGLGPEDGHLQLGRQRQRRQLELGREVRRRCPWGGPRTTSEEEHRLEDDDGIRDKETWVSPTRATARVVLADSPGMFGRLIQVEEECWPSLHFARLSIVTTNGLRYEEETQFKISFLD